MAWYDDVWGGIKRGAGYVGEGIEGAYDWMKGEFEQDEGAYGLPKDAAEQYAMRGMEGLRGEYGALGGQGVQTSAELARLNKFIDDPGGDPYYKQKAIEDVNRMVNQATSLSRGGTAQGAGLAGIMGKQQATTGALGAQYNVGQEAAAQRAGLMSGAAQMGEAGISRRDKLRMDALGGQFQTYGAEQAGRSQHMQDILKRAGYKMGTKTGAAEGMGGIAGLFGGLAKKSDIRAKTDIRDGGEAAGRFMDSLRTSGGDLSDKDWDEYLNQERAERSGVLSDKDGGNFMDSLRANEFRYRRPEDGPQGRNLGIMAQDLERSEEGRRLVSDTPRGKSIDVGGLTTSLAASVGELNERLRRVEGGKALSDKDRKGRR